MGNIETKGNGKKEMEKRERKPKNQKLEKKAANQQKAKSNRKTEKWNYGMIKEQGKLKLK